MAEVHNMSERVRIDHSLDKNGHSSCLLGRYFHLRRCVSLQRRRDRINEKMKALQELIPHANKVQQEFKILEMDCAYLVVSLFEPFLSCSRTRRPC